MDRSFPAEGGETGTGGEGWSVEVGPGVGPLVVEQEEENGEEPERNDGADDGDVAILGDAGVDLELGDDEGQEDDDDVLDEDEEEEQSLGHE